jgi:hypothetical protein
MSSLAKSPSPPHPQDEKPLTSFLVRVHGRPASLRFEIVNLLDGARHVFRRPHSLLLFLQSHGLEPGGGTEAEAGEPGSPPPLSQ